MSKAIWKNGAQTTLAADITDIATSLTLASAATFPAIPAGDWLMLTIYAGSDFEVLKATAISGTTVTVTRGEEGTTAVAWPAGSGIIAAVTASQMAGMHRQLITESEAEEIDAAIGSRAVIMSPEIDLTAIATTTVPIPSTARFYPDTVGLIYGALDTVTVGATITIGTDAGAAVLLGSTALTNSPALRDREVYDPALDRNAAASLTFSVTTGATATSQVCRAYWEGLLVSN